MIVATVGGRPARPEAAMGGVNGTLECATADGPCDTRKIEGFRLACSAEVRRREHCFRALVACVRKRREQRRRAAVLRAHKEVGEARQLHASSSTRHDPCCTTNGRDTCRAMRRPQRVQHGVFTGPDVCTVRRDASRTVGSRSRRQRERGSCTHACGGVCCTLHVNHYVGSSRRVPQ